MKRAFRILALLLALLTVLCVTASAATVYDLTRDTTTYSDCKITLHKVDGKDIAFTTGKIGDKVECVFENVAKIKLTFTPKDKTETFMVFLLKGADATVPQENNIVYLNQNEAEATQTFTIYPSELAADTYQIYVSSATGFTKMGSLVVTADGFATVDFKLGDPTQDEKVNGADALWVLKFAVGKNTDATNTQKSAADTNLDGKVNGADALNILKYAVGRIITF